MTDLLNFPLYVFLGPPGSGKGTLASKLSEKFDYLHLSTGDLLRSYIQKGTAESKELELTLAQGNLVSPALFMKIFLDRIRQPDCEKGLILDGYPRSLYQAKFLDTLVLSPEKIVFVNVRLSDQEVLRRLSGRRLCPGCKKTYHIEFSRPRNENQCDECQTSLIIRTDDQKNVITNRLKLFHDFHVEVLSYYQNRPLWIDINALASPQQCSDDLFSQLQKLLPDSYFEPALTCTKES